MMTPKNSIKRLLCVAMGATSLIALSSPDDLPTYGMRPFPGFVPDVETAINVGQPVMKKLVGAKEFSHIKLKATLEGKFWVIVGKNIKRDKSKGENGDPGFSRVPILKVNKLSGLMSFEMK